MANDAKNLLKNRYDLQHHELRVIHKPKNKDKPWQVIASERSEGQEKLF